MSYLIKDNKVMYTQDDKELAAATFPLVEGRENLININSTYVDESLKGQGIGSTMMKMIVDQAEENNWQILPTCPFATRWFQKHPEYHHLLRSSLGK